MEKLFYKKWSAILTVAAILLVAILLCVLLTFLTQKATLEPRAEELKGLIDAAKKSAEDKQALVEYLKTNEYVRKWAEDNGYIDSNDILFIEENK